MLECEGYKMFRGTAVIVSNSVNMGTYPVSGTWLYKPEYDCWYCKGSSYPAKCVKVLRDEDAVR